MVPHSVREGVEVGRSIDEDEENVRGGLGDDVVGKVGIGGERHIDGMMVSLGRLVQIEYQKRGITLVGIDTTVLAREKGKGYPVNANCLS